MNKEHVIEMLRIIGESEQKIRQIEADIAYLKRRFWIGHPFVLQLEKERDAHSFSTPDSLDTLRYAAADAEFTWSLWQRLRPRQPRIGPNYIRRLTKLQLTEYIPKLLAIPANSLHWDLMFATIAELRYWYTALLFGKANKEAILNRITRRRRKSDENRS